ncbi:DUF1684 domain-containing protein [Catenulispora sp. NF23]|uniref:DUF1684 domain-containing protein n=1 Tax=Catenulispora pinistramenti TaxID=2705254 RepID=A0ABS5KSF4_9ACTN|nr:DUF1684 domain-containing protein [Catenulispora pinistramenti]MBS2536526.1 DUF1684 domain-containing protein [Catenulispora pinistramenti]MBS2548935.1 DUF1684 domain-containing protein [Catenulispora pinistramenti]
MSVAELELADWRRQVSELYAAIRNAETPEAGHATWRAGRDTLFRTHPQSPLPPGDPLRATGLPYWPYDPSLRFALPLLPAADRELMAVPTGGDEVTDLVRIGRVELPEPFGGGLDVWWLAQYGGGLFVPLRDGTAGVSGMDGGSYGGGRYLLDTAKGADLGGSDTTLTIDLNFLYHPSCRYSPEWVCPLAPRGNTIAAAVRAGERMP